MITSLRKILLVTVLFLIPSVQAKKPQEPKQAPAPVSVEQNQQFAYYWYAAKQAIVEERFSDAYVLLKFCNALNPNDATTLCFLGIIEQGIGNNIKGLFLLNNAFEASPRDYWFQYVQALKQLENDSFNETIVQALERAYEDQKPDVKEDLLDELQSAYIKVGNIKRVLEVQDELDQLKGYDTYSAVIRYRAYLLLRKPKKALEEVDRYLAEDPTDLRFLLYKVELLEYLHANKKELYALYETILEVDPYNLHTLNNYAWRLATGKGDLKKAERMSAITIQQEPNNPVYLDTYGWIMHLQGQDELAKFYLQKAQRYETDETRNEIKQHLDAIK